MHKFLLVILLSAFGAQLQAQVVPSAQTGRTNITVGAGMNYWYGDWKYAYRYGPSAWISTDFWKGLGINIEGHSMLIGSSKAHPTIDQYKYVSGKGGLFYQAHRWRTFQPYVKGEVGYASFSHPLVLSISPRRHENSMIYAFGGGAEMALTGHLWLRGDYTYDFYPDFRGDHPINPTGGAIGFSYRFR